MQALGRAVNAIGKISGIERAAKYADIKAAAEKQKDLLFDS